MAEALSFSALKRSRTDLGKLIQAVQQSQGKKGDDRFWEPEVDKAGNGYAVIRFLSAPSQDGVDGLPWVRKFTHGFQGPGGWFIEECPTSIEQKCPVCEMNTVLWNSGIEANKEIVRMRKRKLSYVANILVINDPAHPENNGKIRLFKFGKKIFDKIYEKIHPEFPDETPFSPSDLWDGANFKLKIRTVDKYRNYDKSEFDSTRTPVADTDEALEQIWKQEHSLKEFVSEKIYKSYAQLETRRVKVLGTSPQATTVEDHAPLGELLDDAGTTSKPVESSKPSMTSDDDDDLSYFKSLADQG